MKSAQRGLTLIELMVTLAVAIVVLAIGIPAFTAMSARDMSSATVNALVAALQQARVEAISRGGAVSVVKDNDSWTSWRVQLAIDANADGTIDDASVVRRFEAPRAALVSITGGASPVTFNSLGERSAPAATPTFLVRAYKDSGKTAAGCIKSAARNVVVELVGQVRLENGTCP